MKTINTTLLLLTFALLCVPTADGQTKPANKININDTQYSIVSVALVGVNNEALGVSSYTFTFTVNGNSLQMVAVSLKFNTDDGIDGSYGIDDEDYILDPKTSGYIQVTPSRQILQFFNLESGVCTIARKGGNTYHLTFTYKPREGSTVSGEYYGAVQLSISNM